MDSASPQLPAVIRQPEAPAAPSRFRLLSARAMGERAARALSLSSLKHAVLRYGDVDDAHLDRLAFFSATFFHAFYRWKSYPRSRQQDIDAIRHLSRKGDVIRPSSKILWFLMPCSDPASIPWEESADAIISSAMHGHDLIGLEERRLVRNLVFFLVFFGGYLQRVGDFGSAARLYDQMIRRGFAAEGYFGLANMRHLLANWDAELEEYRQYGIYDRENSVAAEFGIDAPAASRGEAYEEAIRLYRLAVAERPEISFFRLHLGRALLDSGQTEAAREAFAAACQTPRRNPLAPIYLRLLDAARNQDNMAKRRGDFFPVPALRDRYAEIRPVELVSSERIAAMASGRIALADEERLPAAYRAVQHGRTREERAEILYPRTEAIRLPVMRDLGLGLKLGYERYLIADSKALSYPEIKLFTPSVLLAPPGSPAVLGLSARSTMLTSNRILVTLPGAAFNYYHWLFDCLGATALLDAACSLRNFEFVLPAPLTPWQEESMELALSAMPRTRLASGPIDTLVLNDALHLPYPSRLNVPHPEVIRLLRQRISQHKDRPTPGKRVYVPRANVPGRRTANEDAIVAFLRSKGFVAFDPGGMAFSEQVAFFADAEIVVGAAGAGLSNLIFCPAQTKVVMLATAAHYHHTYSALCAATGLSCWVCMGASVTNPNPYAVWSVFEQVVKLEDLRIAVDEALAEIESEAR